MEIPPVSENLGWIPSFYSQEVSTLPKNQPCLLRVRGLVKISDLRRGDFSVVTYGKAILIIPFLLISGYM
jgi:hypothetical protein